MKYINQQIKLLHGDTGTTFESNIIEWLLEVVWGIPTQKNNFDYEMYICKYMKSIISNMDINWEIFNDKEIKISIFYTELVYAILYMTKKIDIIIFYLFICAFFSIVINYLKY